MVSVRKIINNNCELPGSSSAFLSVLFNSGGTGICISKSDGILFLSFLEIKLFSTACLVSSSKLFYNKT